MYGLHQGLAPVEADLKGSPAPLPCRIKVVWESDSADSVAKARALESVALEGPIKSDAQYHRDPEGAYSAEKPFWAEISEAR